MQPSDWLPKTKCCVGIGFTFCHTKRITGQDQMFNGGTLSLEYVQAIDHLIL